MIRDLYPYQVEVRAKLIIDQAALALLSSQEVAQIEQQGVKFEERPPATSSETFFILTPESDEDVGGIQSVYDVMVNPASGQAPQRFCFTREMVERLQGAELDVVQAVNQTIAVMERGWKDSLHYR